MRRILLVALCGAMVAAVGYAQPRTGASGFASPAPHPPPVPPGSVPGTPSSAPSPPAPSPQPTSLPPSTPGGGAFPTGPGPAPTGQVPGAPVQTGPLPSSKPAPGGSAVPPQATTPGGSSTSSTTPAGTAPILTTPLPAPTALPAVQDVEPGEVLVLWRDADEARSGQAAMLGLYQLAPEETVVLGEVGGVLARFRFASPQRAAEAREALRARHPGWIVDLNVRYRPLQGPRQYAAQKIGVPRAPQCVDPVPVRIGMLDGAVARVPALAGADLTTRAFVAVSDESGSEHGTAVAALLVGAAEAEGFSGVARHASLHAAGVVRRDGEGERATTFALVRGLDWLLAERVRVVNVSLGGPGDLLLRAATARTFARGVPVVAAAGNGGPVARPVFPAAYPEVIAVTASDASDRVYVQANRGSYVAIAAPGVDLWVPDAGRGRYVSGTSYATPIVTGALAHLAACAPELPPRVARGLLCRTARDLGDPGPDPVFGCGLVQVGAAAAAMAASR